jgi:glycosyltransferase involved in cell wall biosynthesis
VFGSFPLLLIVAATSLVVWLALTSEWWWGMRRITVLREAPAALTHWPKVSIIIPALNEERTIGESLKSVLALDYPNLEVIAVNDRSTDRTGIILQEMQAQYPQLKVIHIRTLPEGWLGKNHALFAGSRQATGEWLLFTDADVKYAPDALKALVGYAFRNNLDHLAAFPYLHGHSLWLKSFISGFMLLFTVYTQPWRATNPKAKEHIGIGAFALIRRAAYEAAGTHQAIALRPDDDIKLGKLLKRAGFRQEAVSAPDLLAVEWYPSLHEAVHGLNKNAFAGLEYSVLAVLLVVPVLLVTNVLPFFAVLFTQGWTQLLFGLTLLNVWFVYTCNRRFSHLSPILFLLHPFAVSVLVYALLESTVRALIWRRISWRGTSYALDELKRNKV